MVRMQIQLTEAQLDRLRSEARDRRVSIAELVREAVDHLPAHVSMRDRRQRALAAVGAFESGVTDLSARHDDYLAEAYSD